MERQQLKGINRLSGQSHKYLWLLGVAYACKFAYAICENVDYTKHPERMKEWINFFPWFTESHRMAMEIPLMDMRNYVYLLGERLYLSIVFSLLHWYAGTWVTFGLFIFHCLYIFDFFFFFHSTHFGSVAMVTIGILLIPLFIKWFKDE